MPIIYHYGSISIGIRGCSKDTRKCSIQCTLGTIRDWISEVWQLIALSGPIQTCTIQHGIFVRLDVLSKERIVLCGVLH